MTGISRDRKRTRTQRLLSNSSSVTIDTVRINGLKKDCQTLTDCAAGTLTQIRNVKWQYNCFFFPSSSFWRFFFFLPLPTINEKISRKMENLKDAKDDWMNDGNEAVRRTARASASSREKWPGLFRCSLLMSIHQSVGFSCLSSFAVDNLPAAVDAITDQISRQSDVRSWASVELVSPLWPIDHSFP